jgi:hypothetical protein
MLPVEVKTPEDIMTGVRVRREDLISDFAVAAHFETGKQRKPERRCLDAVSMPSLFGGFAFNLKVVPVKPQSALRTPGWNAHSRAVVGHHPLDPDAALSEPAQCTF